MNDKLMKVTCHLETKTEILMFVLFPTFAIDLENQILTVSVNQDFKFILNEITKNFTRFDLKEFIEIDGKYTKTLYRLLKQYRSTGYYEVSIENFKSIMDCPKSYNNKQFMQNIVSPAIKNLQKYFQNLKCESKYAHKRGKPVTGYIFSFTPETIGNQLDDERKEEVENMQNSSIGYVGFPQRKYDYKELEKMLLNNPVVTEGNISERELKIGKNKV